MASDWLKNGESCGERVVSDNVARRIIGVYAAVGVLFWLVWGAFVYGGGVVMRFKVLSGAKADPAAIVAVPGDEAIAWAVNAASLVLLSAGAGLVIAKARRSKRVSI